MVDFLMSWYKNCKDLPSPRAWDFRDNIWMTPLQYAVVAGSLDVVRSLLHWDSDAARHHVNGVNYFRRSALHMACGHAAPALVDELLANRSVDANLVDCCAFTPLHWAVYVGAAEVVRSFISRGNERTIRMTEEDSQGRSVLQLAVENRDLDRKVGRDIQKLLLTVPEVKDEIEGLYRDRQVFVDAANAILVGAALIASVTFGGWLQPPGGSDSELQIFWAFNSLSFFFSLATVLAGAGTVLPMSDVYIGNTVRSIRRWLALTSLFLLVSVLSVLGAFAAAGFASLRPIPLLRLNMTTTTSVGSVVCFTTGLLFLNRLLKIKVLDDFRVLFSDLSTRIRPPTCPRRMHKFGGLPRSIQFDPALQRAGIDSEVVAERRYFLADKALARLLYAGREHRIGHPPVDTSTVVARMKVYEDAFRQVRLRTAAVHATLVMMDPAHGVEGPKDDEEATWAMLFLAELSPYGLHHWTEVPSVLCRERALAKDKEELQIQMSGLEEKRSNLEAEENMNRRV